MPRAKKNQKKGASKGPRFHIGLRNKRKANGGVAKPFGKKKINAKGKLAACNPRTGGRKSNKEKFSCLTFEKLKSTFNLREIRIVLHDVMKEGGNMQNYHEKLSVKDFASMKPGSSKDQEAEVMDLEENGISDNNDSENRREDADDEFPHQDSQDSDESMDQESGEVCPVEDVNGKGDHDEVPTTDDLVQEAEVMDLEENGISDNNDGENRREDADDEFPHQDSQDSDESMDQESGEVCPVEDVKGKGDHDEVPNTDDLVKRVEDASLDEKVSTDDTEEKICGDIDEELNKNDEESKISVKEDPNEVSEVAIVAVVVGKAEELDKSSEKFEIVVKDPKEISGAEMVKNHVEVSPTIHLVKCNEDVNLGQVVIINGTEENGVGDNDGGNVREGEDGELPRQNCELLHQIAAGLKKPNKKSSLKVKEDEKVSKAEMRMQVKGKMRI